MFGNRPRALMCHICGREFGTQSLGIHIKSCTKKWEDQESLKPKKDRRPVPSAPKAMNQVVGNGKDISWNEMENYNRNANDNFIEQSLCLCENCGRKFNENALRVHQKACTPDHPSKGVKGKEFPSTGGVGTGNRPSGGSVGNNFASNSSPNKLKPEPQKVYKDPSPSRPKTLMCYICGREFGTSSLAIHIKSCIKKWEDEENKKPKASRRPVPQPPTALFDVLSCCLIQVLQNPKMSTDEINDYNKIANKKYVAEAMVKCPFCGRTFTDQSFKSHQKSCTADKPAKGVGVGNVGGGGGALGNQFEQKLGAKGYGGGYEIEDNYEEVQRAECNVCGRKFAIDRLAKHEKVCKKAKIKDESRPKPKEKPKDEKPQPVASNKWRNQHEEFMENLKYNREIKKREEKGLSIKDMKAPPKRVVDDGYIKCPHCDRRFNEKAAERHIPSCATTINKPKSVAQSVGIHTGKSNLAKKQMEESKNNYNPKKYK